MLYECLNPTYPCLLISPSDHIPETIQEERRDEEEHSANCETPPDSVVFIKLMRLQITDAALGLQYLHNRHPPVVHSGMRGDNVLITDSGGAILSGFGLTKVSPRFVGLESLD